MKKVLLLFCMTQITNSIKIDNASEKDEDKNNIFTKMNDYKRTFVDMDDKSKQNHRLATNTLKDNHDEHCNWRADFLGFLTGRLCGKYYKILDSSRKDYIDLRELRNKFRQKSLLLHPDKNSSPLASEAFSALREAYECLSDSNCKYAYDENLLRHDIAIAQHRHAVLTQLKSQVVHGVVKFHYYLSFAASLVNQAGEFVNRRVSSLKVLDVPVGPFLLLAVLTKYRQTLLIAFSLSKAIVHFNRFLINKYYTPGGAARGRGEARAGGEHDFDFDSLHL